MNMKSFLALALCLASALIAGAVTISGTIQNPMGSPLSGDNTVRGSGGISTTAPSGPYSLTVSNGWGGVIVVERPNEGGPGNYACFNPQMRAYTNVTSDLSGQDFKILGVAPPPPAGNNFRTIKGTVTNGAGSGVFEVLLVATTNGGAALTYSNGTYYLGYFFTSNTWSGTVTPQKVGTTFTPTQRIYSSINTTQSNQDYLAGGGGPSGLSLWKSVDDQSVTGGQTVAFTLKLTNQTPGAVTNTTVRDTVSAWLACATGTISSGGTYDTNTLTITWSLGTFAAGSGTSLTFSATVSTSVTAGTVITNVGRWSGDGLGTNYGNIVTLTVPIVLPMRADKRFGGGGGNMGGYADRAALGIAYERMPVNITTSDFYNPAGIDFSDADMKVKYAQTNQIRKFGIISYYGSGVWPPETNLGPVVARYVERYDGDGIDDMPGLTVPVQHWEIFNEYTTNYSGYSGCDEGKYARYLSNAYVWAHGAHPGITIVASAVATARGGSRDHWYLEKFLTNTWVTNYFDAVHYHAYEDFYPFTNGAVVEPDYLFARDFLDFMEEKGLAGRELWSTETDASSTYMEEGQTNTQADNARFIARIYPFALACGVDHMFYTELEYSSMFPAHLKWAVMVSNGVRRMSFYVFQKQIEKLEDFSRAHLHEYSAGDFSTQFAISNHETWVVWNYSNKTSSTVVPIGPVSQARITQALPATYDNTNATWTVTTNAVSNGYVTVSTSPDAVYVEPIGSFTNDIDGDGLANDQDDDLDGDGMPNDYEYGYLFNQFVSDVGLDADGDGADNPSECIAGTDPTNSGSSFQVSDADRGGTSQFIVRWQSVTGRTYSVQYSPALIAPSWTNTPGGDSIAGDGTQKSHTNDITGTTNRNYRLKVWRTE